MKHGWLSSFRLVLHGSVRPDAMVFNCEGSCKSSRRGNCRVWNGTSSKQAKRCRRAGVEAQPLADSVLSTADVHHVQNEIGPSTNQHHIRAEKGSTATAAHRQSGQPCL